MARPEKRGCICSMPLYRKFKPECGESSGKELLSFDEYEVFRLLNLEKKTQNECAERMQISRSTVSRIYDSAGEKIARALVLGRKLVIDGGDVMVCEKMRPECIGEKHCCHIGRDFEIK